jgi:hypothetical protein
MKWTMPSFLVTIITVIAITLNKRFLWDLDPQQIIASVSLAVNFVGVTIISDIAKMRRGESPNWNSTKLFTLLFVLLIVGFSEYVGIQLEDADIWWIAGMGAAFITGKGIKDLIPNKQEVSTVEPTQPTTFISNNK